MQIEDGNMSSDSDRAALDRHAVAAAGQLLISAIWLEHRLRYFSTRLPTLPSQRASMLSDVNSPIVREDQRVPASDGSGRLNRHATKRIVGPQ
jgi:hypothetical protein